MATTHGPQIEKGVYTIRIKGATIAPRRPDGSPWHVTKADSSAVLVGAAAGLVVGNPELGMEVGGTFADRGGDPLAPLAYVRVKLAGSTFTIPPGERSYSPVWDQPIEIDTRNFFGDELVVIEVVDAVDSGLLAYANVSLSELLATPAQTLTNLEGSVPSLDVEALLQANASAKGPNYNEFGGSE